MDVGGHEAGGEHDSVDTIRGQKTIDASLSGVRGPVGSPGVDPEIDVPVGTGLLDAVPQRALVVGAEASVIIKSIQRANEMLEAGETREVSFRSERMATLIRVINGDYFVAVTLSPDGNIGKARFLLRLAAPKLREELEN